MKATILWDLTSRSPMKFNRRFGETYCLHLWGRRINKARALFAICFHSGFFLGLFSDPEDGDNMFLRNVCWLLTDYTALYVRRCCLIYIYISYRPNIKRCIKINDSLVAIPTELLLRFQSLHQNCVHCCPKQYRTSWTQFPLISAPIWSFEPELNILSV
jgi:hypothetical protein